MTTAKTTTDVAKRFKSITNARAITPDRGYVIVGFPRFTDGPSQWDKLFSMLEEYPQWETFDMDNDWLMSGDKCRVVHIRHTDRDDLE